MNKQRPAFPKFLHWDGCACSPLTPLFVWTTTGPTMHLSICCTPRLLVRCRRGECAHCGCMWLTVKLVCHGEDKPLSESPSRSSLLPSQTATAWPVFPGVDPLTSDLMRLQKQTHPGQRGRLSLRHQRHSVVGVLTIQRAQSDWLPALPSVVSAKGSRADGRHLTLRKAVSEERPQSIGGESLPKSLLSQMEQGEKERVRERGCNTTNAHLQKEREREKGQSYKEPGRQRGKVAQSRHTTRDSCSETHFLHGQPTQLTNTRKWMSQTVVWFIES